MITFMLGVDYEEGDYGSYKESYIEHHESGISLSVSSDGPIDDMVAIDTIAEKLHNNGFITLCTSSWDGFLMDFTSNLQEAVHGAGKSS